MTCQECHRKAVARGLCQHHYAAMRDAKALAEGRLCSFTDCGRPVRGRQEICQLHYNQRWAGKPLAPITRRISATFDAEGRRRCNACGVPKVESEFVQARNICRGCSHNLFRYKMSPQDFAARLKRQGGGCAVCGTSVPGGRWNAWHVDHDHSCCDGESKATCGKCVRGILCNHCNLGIGFLGNDASRARAVADYLEGAQANFAQDLMERTA